MTKDDYMKLSKERLAELNVEKDIMLMCNNNWHGGGNDNWQFPTFNGIPCFAPGGYCTNPQMDCVNCPKNTTGGGYYTISNEADSQTNIMDVNHH
jgi:hypothetical protein